MSASKTADPTWIDCALAQLGDPSTQQALRLVLKAFAGPFPRGGPPPPPEMLWTQDFPALLAWTQGRYSSQSLVNALAQEVDLAQAQLFVRRLDSVVELLASLQAPDQESGIVEQARVLMVALWHRASLIGNTHTPKALRIRALADFYYSQTVTLVHASKNPKAPTLTQIMQGLQYKPVSAGIEHAHYAGPCPVGPINLNLLRIQIDKVKIRAVNCRDKVQRKEPFAQWAAPLCDAGISGGFFLYSENDIEAPSARRDPVGLLVCDGQVHNPPTFARAALIQAPSGQLEIRPVSPFESQWFYQDTPLAIEAIINRAHQRVGPDRPSLAVVGQEVWQVGSSLPVPLNGVVLVLQEPDALEALKIQPGSRLRWDSPWPQAIAGGPMLIQEGKPCLDLQAEDFWGSAPPVTFSQDETGDTNLLARLALGLSPDGHLYALAVDGRNFERSLGMTLAGMGEMMQALGCVQAANMDGGSSKRMLIQGQTVDLPSTEIIAKGEKSDSIRPVHSALLFSSKS